MSAAADTAPVAIVPGEPLPPWCDTLWQNLAARAASGSLPHALLLCGPAGLGKRALADAFVRARLCEALQDGHACGTCRACRLLAAGTHPDRVLVTLEENPRPPHKLRTEIVIDQIRALSARLAMSSQLDGWQIAVIDPAEVMNIPAQNALLKTLEEPTAASLVILIADQPWRLTATIRSRCQRLDFVVPQPELALAWLATRGVAHPEAMLAAAGGNPGQAWLLSEQGGMQRRQDVARDLLAMAAGKGDARAIGRAWADDEPAQRLEQASRLLEGALRARALATRTRFDPGWDAATLAAAARRADQLRQQVTGPLRNDLALFEWLDALPRSTGDSP
jgi:DNA polymerase-3 subunit delta'